MATPLHRLCYLLLSDFDGTIARTFETSPNNIGVAEAYEYALAMVFGDGVLEIYQDLGGLQNRTPGQLVHELLERVPTLIHAVHDRYPGEFDQASDIEAELAEVLVAHKLELLLQEIGSDWPRPCSGFIDFVQILQRTFPDGEVELGIVSSGHTQFIEATFSAWGIQCPRVLVTEDHIRRLGSYKLGKPAPFTFLLAEQQWMGFAPSSMGRSRARTMYFGDDPAKDGGLAVNLGRPFGWYSPEVPDWEAHSFPDGSFHFGDWLDVAEYILAQAERFCQGHPCEAIFAGFTRRQ